jgi:2-keto-4-pentenoate hydratase/2-oxohepta-3-ene-1,7-dioic acid hydratase in catechol pathway
MPLAPGDVIAPGTPEGIGIGFTRRNFCKTAML